MPSLSAMFQNTLNAPLANTRWSWGAVNHKGDVIMRVWSDKDEFDYKNKTVLVLHPVNRNGVDISCRPGYQEREEHLDMIRNGSKFYMVVCNPKDPNANVREVKDFRTDRVYVGGILIQDPNNPNNTLATWITLIEPSQI